MHSNISSPALLAQETAWRADPVPAQITNILQQTPVFAISKDEFLLALPFGLRFHYARGKGVAVERSAGVTDSEVDLFMAGSVTGAIAWMNGLVPLHASAVVHDGRVHAFTGVSGAGKSTLAAALARRGLTLFADDVLILDIRDGRITCLPGHKKLKLWQDALTLTGLESSDRVRPSLDKFYLPLGNEPDQPPLPLHSLWFLQDQARGSPEISDIRGVQAFQMARSAFYRPRYCDAVIDRKAMFATQSAIAMQCALRKFDRPKRADMFDACADRMAELICGAD